MTDARFEALTGAYRQLASGLSAMLRAYRRLWPNLSRAPEAREMIAGALAQLEELGVSVVYIQEENPPGQWLRDHPEARYSVEWMDNDPGPCLVCTAPVGLGPIGWLRGAGPLCDRCMVERCSGLGRMLQAASVIRELGAIDRDSGENLDEVVTALATYARLYERVSRDQWPYRPVGILRYLRGLSSRVERKLPRWATFEEVFRQGGGSLN